ncbi:DUF4054 domain-containing protein [Ureibacillus sp. Re31]|uniref:DUF4054 domain-containing protein n=1 Tax=Ureibacillus galli TaxID=2762222 RepID=A0ABR8XB30_9BACL|nr:DUF4054 domain-containing protein [Ureibacillus galli]MBD8026428.1 DUF4054 domain-containing protein [Ureibacillus galli]
MLTTPEKVRMMGKEFTNMTDEQLNMYIEDASLEVSSLSVPDEQKERLTRYLAAHLASVNTRKIVREKVDVIERQYSDQGSTEGLLSTPYGQEYQRILKKISKKTINLMVL